MGFLDKLRGKKKEEDFGLGMEGLGGDPNQFGQFNPSNQQQGYDPYGGSQQPQPGFDQPMGVPDQQFGSYQQPQQQQFGQQQFSPEASGFERVQPGQPFTSQGQSSQGMHDVNSINIGKDLEIISAKLDAIKAELDSMNQRIKRMERLAEEPGSKKDAWQY